MNGVSELMAELPVSIESTISEATLTITLNRPEAGNALRHEDREHIIELLNDAHTNSTVRVIVIRANGRHFCAGADMAGVGSNDRPVVGDITRRIMGGAQRLISAVLDCHKPVISVVHGAAAGMGAHLAYASDFIIASDQAKFIESFVLRGLTVDAGGAYLLPRIVGMQKAKELALLGDSISADYAHSLGLITRVVSAEELDATVDGLVDRLSKGATTAIGLTKQLFNSSLDSDRAAAFQAEAFAQELQSHSTDSTEGVTAFSERRPTAFTGR